MSSNRETLPTQCKTAAGVASPIIPFVGEAGDGQNAPTKVKHADPPDSDECDPSSSSNGLMGVLGCRRFGWNRLVTSKMASFW